MAGDQAGARVDSWIWSVRLAKTRSLASAACRAGHVRVNGARVKPAQAVRAGDEVRLRDSERERIVVVVQVITKRVGGSRVLYRQQPAAGAAQRSARGGGPRPRRGPPDQARAPQYREVARTAVPLSRSGPAARATPPRGCNPGCDQRPAG